MTLRTLSAAAAIEELQTSGVLAHARIGEALSLRPLCDGDVINQPIQLEHCVLEDLDASGVEFSGSVLVDQCELSSAQFFAAYFLAGLVVRRCTFAGTVDFQCGGHNRGGSSIRLEDNIFHGFVNFFDCWYEGPFEMHRCVFENGTNLFGNKGKPYEVRFDVEPIISAITGRVEEDGEGTA